MEHKHKVILRDNIHGISQKMLNDLYGSRHTGEYYFKLLKRFQIYLSDKITDLLIKTINDDDSSLLDEHIRVNNIVVGDCKFPKLRVMRIIIELVQDSGIEGPRAVTQKYATYIEKTDPIIYHYLEQFVKMYDPDK